MRVVPLLPCGPPNSLRRTDPVPADGEAVGVGLGLESQFAEAIRAVCLGGARAGREFFEDDPRGIFYSGGRLPPGPMTSLSRLSMASAV